MTKKTSLTWNLDDILKVEDFDNLYKDLKGRMKGFGEHLDAMQPDMTTEEFRAYIDFSQLFSKDMARLGSLPHLMEAVDTCCYELHNLISQKTLLINPTY